MSWCYIYYITSVILYIYSGYVTASEYYVSAAPNGEPCPSTYLPCHNISYYNSGVFYFTDDTVFYFLEGTHILQGPLRISDVSNITLQGLGHVEQVFYETVMQSASLIKCIDNNRAGIQFTNSTDVVMKSLTIANCGFHTFISHQGYVHSANVSLFVADVNNFTLEWVSVQNGSVFGLCLVNTFDVLIVNSNFANNKGPKDLGGNALIVYDDHHKGVFTVNIVKSNFTFGLLTSMGLWYGNNIKAKVVFENCTFSHNIVKVGGGVYIVSYGTGSIEFRNCTLYNNTASVYGGGVYFRSRGNVSIEFQDCTIYAQHDGGGVYIDSHGNSRIEFKNCTIYKNAAQQYGGGVYIHSNGNSSIEFCNCTIYNNSVWYIGRGGGVYIRSNGESGSIEFHNCSIFNNIAHYDGGGGGVAINLLGGGSIVFSNCIIYNNIAQDGGGVYIDLYEGGGNIKFGHCIIYNNAAYLGSGLFLRALLVTSTGTFYFQNVLFQFNKASNKLVVYRNVYQSAVVLFNIANVIFDQIDVSNHNTTGLVGFNSLLTFHGYNTFVNNSGIDGGGISLYESSQLLLKGRANISFVNNHASDSGGGIFVSQVLDVEKSIDCSFEVIPYYNSSAVLYFVNNTADISGDVLYGGNVDNCSNEEDLFKNLFQYPQQTGLSVVSSDPIQVCFCESDKPNCSITNINITVIPGIDVNISLATVGLNDGLTQGVIKLTSSDNSSTVQTRLNANCTNVHLKTNLLLDKAHIYARLESEPSLAKIIEVTIKSCPIGFMLGKDACICGPELNLSSITCDINTKNIIRDGNLWIGYKNDSDCLIVYQHCPFDYCNDQTIQFKVTSPDPQCLHKRSGILCGQCTKGFSLMLGSNQCGQCTNDHIALIIPFAVAGIALVALVIVLNLTVSVGTINGLIFYANVVKIYEHIFFPGGPVPFLSQFISWINLDLGIKTCFYHGMGSCSKAWLQFIFPAYVWFILILIIILLRYSSKVVQLVGRQAIPVLATMILLSYTKLIRTVFHIIHYTNIQCNNDISLRWYIDANIQYVGGCHIPLFILSLAVFTLLIVPYTFYLLTIPLFEGPLCKYMSCCQKLSIYMKPFFDAYGGPYKDKCRFWTGFLLLVRVVLALVVSEDTEDTTSLDVLTSLLIIIMFMYFPLRGMYRHFPLVCLEVIFILNLMFMTHINLQTSEKSKRQVSSIVSVSVAFVIFCGIILYQVWNRLLKSHSQKTISKVKEILKKPPPPSCSNNIKFTSTIYNSIRAGPLSVESTTPSMSVVLIDTRREPLLCED